MIVKIGDKVKFTNEDLVGEITAIVSDDKVRVSCSDGFEHTVNLSDIIIVGEDNQLNYSLNASKLSDKISANINDLGSAKFLNRYTNTSKYKMGRLVEIDLHLEELVEFPNKLDDWQKLHTQMQHVKNCLGAATAKKVKHLVFIHGVGTGVLKTELHNYLSRFENLDFKVGDFNTYGTGATEVTINY
jgi:dsDNA-specific endonuclease/ATPase MutS2